MQFGVIYEISIVTSHDDNGGVFVFFILRLILRC